MSEDDLSARDALAIAQLADLLVDEADVEFAPTGRAIALAGDAVSE
ncbi:hypothetical protein [Halorubrum sp. BV1]|nr:hypothetical protein [Halorubrum sp. BV1]